MNSDLIIRNELRKEALNARDLIPEEMRDAYSQLIRRRTIEYIDSISATFVHCYIGFRSEVKTQGIIEDLFERKIKVAVPVILGEGNEERMIHTSFTDLDSLHPGMFGVPEPDIVNEVPLDELSAVIIPLVAFDGFGMRLGYGKGYYDRFLATIPEKITRIGLAFSIQEVDKIPKISHDQLINNVITEQSNFIFK